jgi:hypothetical protein
MRGLIKAWPCKKSFGPAPEEEVKEEEPVFPKPLKEGLDRLIRDHGYAFAAVYIHMEEEEGSARAGSPQPY